MDNLFIKDVNNCSNYSNHFLKSEKFFNYNAYYITMKKTEKDYYSTILRNTGLNCKKVYAAQYEKHSKPITNQEYSYLNTWKSVLQKEKDNYVLMLDDDVRFSYNFSINLRRFLTYVPNDWDILYLGASQHIWDNIVIKENYYEACNTKGSFAVFLSPFIIQKVVTALNESNIPVDEILNKLDCKKYVAYPNVVISDVAYSSIRQPRKNVKIHAEKMHWNLNIYDYFKYLRLNVLFVVNSFLSKQSYVNITYFYIKSKKDLINNENYKEKIKNYDIIITYFYDEPPSYFYVEKEIKFILKTEQ